MSTHTQVIQSLASATQVCFWVILVSLLLLKAGRLLMKAARARMVHPERTESVEKTAEGLERSFLPIALAGLLGPALAQFTSLTLHSAWHVHVQALITIVAWLWLSVWVAERAISPEVQEPRSGTAAAPE